MLSKINHKFFLKLGEKMFFVITREEWCGSTTDKLVFGPFESEIMAAAYLLQKGYSPFVPFAPFEPFGRPSNFNFERPWESTSEWHCGPPLIEEEKWDDPNQCSYDAFNGAASVLEAKIHKKISLDVEEPFVVVRSSRYFSVDNYFSIIGLFETNIQAENYLAKQGYIPSVRCSPSVGSWSLPPKKRERKWNNAWIEQVYTPVWVPPAHPEFLLSYLAD